MSLRKERAFVSKLNVRRHVLRKRNSLSPCLLAAWIAILAASASAQAPASVSGTIKDPTGAVVVQAVVSVTAARTSAKKQTATNEAGSYAFTDLATGEYTL